MLEASEELILATNKKRSRKPSDKIVAALESDDSLTHKLQNKPASKRKHVVMLPRPPLKQLVSHLFSLCIALCRACSVNTEVLSPVASSDVVSRLY
jgi:hypothetical protein